MHVYLETPRMILRQLTMDDLDAIEALDADPGVMRYINGGRPTPREELRTDYLPFWLAYYERGDAWGFWAAEDRETARSSAGSTSGPTRRTRPTSPSSGTGWSSRHGARATRPRGRAPSSTRRSPSWAPGASTPARWS